MKFIFSAIILLISLNTSLYSQSEKVFFTEGIVFVKNFQLDIKDTLVDGKYYKYPSNWNFKKGNDNIFVSYPTGWILNEGKDGHLVAFPENWTVNESKDGRLVSFPYEEKLIKYKEKKKDCVEKEEDDCTINITKTINKYGLYTKQGQDGRLIVYTKDMNLAQSPSGRLVNLPKGWEISQNTKGQFSAYPKNWDAFVLEEDKEVAMPKNWTIDPQTNSPKIIQGDNFMKFIYSPVQKVKLAEAIYNNDKTNGLNYIIYILFNQ